MAADNVLALIRAEEDGTPGAAQLKEYKAPPYGIKVSLGRVSLGCPLLAPSRRRPVS